MKVLLPDFVTALISPPPCRPLLTSYSLVTISNSRIASTVIVSGPEKVCPVLFICAPTPSIRMSVLIGRAPPRLTPLPESGDSFVRSWNRRF